MRHRKPSRGRGATALLAVASAFVAVAAFVVALEVVLQFLPVQTGLNVQPVTSEQPVFRFEPYREAVFSKNWDLALANRIHTNNAGFVNRVDYEREANTPLLAVIGDSYVEAAIVPEDETVHARLQDRFGEARRVYSFAASGAGLAQYLSWARHARDSYRPDAAVFLIISNDFSEALWSRERNPGFHGFRRVGLAEDRGESGGENKAAADWSLELAPYEPSPLRVLARRSALLRYLVLNLQVVDFMRSGLLAGDQEQRWVGNVPTEVDSAYFDEAMWAAQIFLDQAPVFAGVPRERIVIAIDGVRPAVYDNPTLEGMSDAYWLRIRNAFIAEARASGYDVIDMHEAFVDDYARNGRRFEHELDSHWNGDGHRVLAERLLARPLLSGLGVPGPRLPSGLH